MPARILIAEDEEHIARLIEFKLRKDGWIAQIAPDGGQASSLLKTEDWDLLVLDIMMPVKDGWQVLRELRASAKNAAIPVLMLTAKGRTERLLAQDPAWGRFELLAKPFDPGTLSAHIRALLGEGA